jgi:hypothetical protein
VIFPFLGKYWARKLVRKLLPEDLREKVNKKTFDSWMMAEHYESWVSHLYSVKNKIPVFPVENAELRDSVQNSEDYRECERNGYELLLLSPEDYQKKIERFYRKIRRGGYGWALVRERDAAMGEEIIKSEGSFERIAHVTGLRHAYGEPNITDFFRERTDAKISRFKLCEADSMKTSKKTERYKLTYLYPITQ